MIIKDLSGVAPVVEQYVYRKHRIFYDKQLSNSEANALLDGFATLKSGDATSQATPGGAITLKVASACNTMAYMLNLVWLAGKIFILRPLTAQIF